MKKLISKAWLVGQGRWTPVYYYGTLSANENRVAIKGYAPGLEDGESELLNISLAAISKVVVGPGSLLIKANGQKHQVYFYNYIKGAGGTANGNSLGGGYLERVRKNQPGIGNVGEAHPTTAIPISNEYAEFFENNGLTVKDTTNSPLSRWFVRNQESNLKWMSRFDNSRVNSAWNSILKIIAFLTVLLSLTVALAVISNH